MIFVDEDLELSNTYEDGTRGVTAHDREEYAATDDMPHCVICLQEVIRDD